MSRPPDSAFRYSTATLEWAREEHATLGEWSSRRADGQHLRTALLVQSLQTLLGRTRTLLGRARTLLGRMPTLFDGM